jgi:hypothetical protein
VPIPPPPESLQQDGTLHHPTVDHPSDIQTDYSKPTVK